MTIHTITPFRIDKNLGKSYNETMALIGDDDWCCLKDADTCFLTPDYGNILYEYANQNKDAGLLTCLTNRISPLSTQQLFHGRISDNPDMRYHINIAEQQKKYLYKTTVINRDISGMLMLLSKKAWTEHKFSEDGKCLAVDTEYNRRIREAGKEMLLMCGLYLWHSYRLNKPIHNKLHLL